jgi:hypothetical protein
MKNSVFGAQPLKGHLNYGIAEQLAEKVIPDREPCPQRLKPNSKQGGYRSGKPLRHLEFFRNL